MNSDINNDTSIRLKKLKQELLVTAKDTDAGHVPSSLSSLEILFTLYNGIANINKENAKDKDRDRVILSKEHARLAQIVVLAECGLINKELLATFMCDDGALGHDIYGIISKNNIDVIDVSSGSLGHGPGVACGYAWDSKSNIYVVVGDGELQEGSCWESIMFAGHHKLSNFILIVDKNNQQIDNYTQNIIDSSTTIADSIKSFGFDIFECDGHNIQELKEKLKIKSDKPKCIIANTVKGKEIKHLIEKKGFGFFHWKELDDKEFDVAMETVND